MKSGSRAPTVRAESEGVPDGFPFPSHHADGRVRGTLLCVWRLAIVMVGMDMNTCLLPESHMQSSWAARFLPKVHLSLH